jgi:hypothetical protein
VDESATGSLNFAPEGDLHSQIPFAHLRPSPFDYHRPAMHLRMPSIDQGVQAFAWAVFFFLVLWIGMLAVGVSSATALILSLIAGGAIFVFVRTRGEDRPGDRVRRG